MLTAGGSTGACSLPSPPCRPPACLLRPAHHPRSLRQRSLAAAAPLEGYAPDAWVAFDRVLVVKDVYTGGVRTFLDTKDAHLFRKMLYAQVGGQATGGSSVAGRGLWGLAHLPLPQPPAPCRLPDCPLGVQYNLPPPRLRQPLPRTITFQRKRANRRVVNEEALLKMLAEFGEVRCWRGALPAPRLASLCRRGHPFSLARRLRLPPVHDGCLPCPGSAAAARRCGWWSSTPPRPSASSWRPWPPPRCSSQCTPPTWPTPSSCSQAAPCLRSSSATGFGTA